MKEYLYENLSDYIDNILFKHANHGSESRRWIALEKGDHIDIIAPGYGSHDKSVDIASKNIPEIWISAKNPREFY